MAVGVGEVAAGAVPGQLDVGRDLLEHFLTLGIVMKPFGRMCVVVVGAEQLFLLQVRIAQHPQV